MFFDFDRSQGVMIGLRAGAGALEKALLFFFLLLFYYFFRGTGVVVDCGKVNTAGWYCVGICVLYIPFLCGNALDIFEKITLL